MKRYKLTNEFKELIRKNPKGINELSKQAEFEVKNIYNKNKTISQDHLEKLSPLLKTKITLKETKINYGRNLGLKAFTQPIKEIKKSNDLAEFIGIMLGDGNLYKNRTKIAFDSRNPEYVDYVFKICEKLFGITFKREDHKDKNCIYLQFNNHIFTDELIKLGLKRGNKLKNQLGIPEWIKENKEFSRACIRGLIDTDGCIYKCKREKQTYIKFTNYNKKLLEDFKEVTKNLGYSFAKANKQNACLYRKDEVASFIKDIKPLKSIFGVVV
tara:strand:+ start:1713 stop:2522 length:810 start_codon:yes stop_codon:yes gene_type:complete